MVRRIARTIFGMASLGALTGLETVLADAEEDVRWSSHALRMSSSNG